MSREYYPFDLSLSALRDEAIRMPITGGERTPTSNFSTGFESSAFGSGSSVLSAFEPPSEAELLEKSKLAQLLDDNNTFPGSLEELKTMISRLQAIYFYRQGLKALSDEIMLQQGGQSGGLPYGNGLHVQTPTLSTPPSIPEMNDSIWRVDDVQLSLAARAVEAAATETSVLRNYGAEHPLQHDHVHRNNDVLESNKPYRRKSRRQHSCPVALCAPQWADASWNPRTQVRNHTESVSHGTGVFLPPQLRRSDMSTHGSSSLLMTTS